MQRQRGELVPIGEAFGLLDGRLQAEAQGLLTQIPYAPTRQEAKKRRDQFAKRFRGQYPDAARRCSSAMGTAW